MWNPQDLRNNAVYDRRWDWVLIGPADGATRIEPKRVDVFKEKNLPDFGYKYVHLPRTPKTANCCR